MSDNPLFGVPELWLTAVSPQTAAVMIYGGDTAAIPFDAPLGDLRQFVDAMLPAFMLEPAEDKARWPKDMRGDGGSVIITPEQARFQHLVGRSPLDQALRVLPQPTIGSGLMSNVLATEKWGG